MFKNLNILLLILTITACASAGHRINRTHIDDIENGVQHKSQIRAWFGEPYTIKTGLKGHPNGCVERWSFEYAKARGLSGIVTYSEILIVDFDTEKKVCDHAFSKSGSE